MVRKRKQIKHLLVQMIKGRALLTAIYSTYLFLQIPPPRYL